MGTDHGIKVIRKRKNIKVDQKIIDSLIEHYEQKTGIVALERDHYFDQEKMCWVENCKPEDKFHLVDLSDGCMCELCFDIDFYRGMGEISNVVGTDENGQHIFTPMELYKMSLACNLLLSIDPKKDNWGIPKELDRAIRGNNDFVEEFGEPIFNYFRYMEKKTMYLDRIDRGSYSITQGDSISDREYTEDYNSRIAQLSKLLTTINIIDYMRDSADDAEYIVYYWEG